MLGAMKVWILGVYSLRVGDCDLCSVSLDFGAEFYVICGHFAYILHLKTLLTFIFL